MPNAKQYYDELFQSHKEFNEKLANLKNELKTNPRVHFTISNSERDAKNAENKLYNFFSCLTKKVPEDKKHEVNELLKPLFYTGSFKDNAFKTQYKEQLDAGRYDFEFFKFQVFKEERRDKVIEIVSSYLSEKDIEEAINDNEIYATELLTKKEKVKILDKQVTDAKAFVEANETDTAKKEEILKELDLINETVIGTTDQYRKSIADLDPEYERGRTKLEQQAADAYIAKNNPGSLKFIETTGTRSGLMNYKVIEYNKEEFKNHRENTKINISDKNKESTIKVLKAIEKMGIYNPIDTGNEQGTKIYGFRQIFDAQKAIEDALENHDFSNLKVLRENYEKSLENMRELFKLVKEEFNPGPESTVGNLNNHRHQYVPYEFVDDLTTNSTVSSLYNMYTVIKRLGCTPEEFVNDPAKYIDEFRKDMINTNLDIDVRTEGKSIAESFAHSLYWQLTPNPIDVYPNATFTRIMEGLKNRETDPALKEELSYNAKFLSTVDSIYSDYSGSDRGKYSYLANNYLDYEGSKTICNVLLVNDEDRVYSKLRAYTHFAKDDLTKIKPFNVKDYLMNTYVDPKKFIERIIETTKESYKIAQEKIQAAKEEQEKTGKSISNELTRINDGFNVYLNGAQRAVELYLYIKSPSLAHVGLADDENIATLKEMLKDPKMMFGDKNINLSKEVTDHLEEIKDADKIYEDVRIENEKSVKTIIANIRKEEKEQNKILKKAFKEFLKGNQNEYILESQSILNTLKAKYEKGILPRDYYEQRVNAIENIIYDPKALDKKIPLLGDGAPKNLKEFIKFKGLENDVKNNEISQEEINGLYESYKFKVEHDKQVFLNTKSLIKDKSIPAPSQASNEPIHSEVKPVVKKQEGPVKISVKLDEETTDLSKTTKINDLDKEKDKSKEKNNGLDV